MKHVDPFKEWILEAQRRLEQAELEGTLVTIELDRDNNMEDWIRKQARKYRVRQNVVFNAAILLILSREDES